MMPELEKYWQAVQNTVCRVCIDSDPYGNGVCRISEMSMCGVKEYFPKIVEIILSVKSDKMDDYIVALRENICKKCRQTPDGVCDLRNSVECALDRYFSLIIQAIESIINSLFLVKRLLISTVDMLITCARKITHGCKNFKNSC